MYWMHYSEKEWMYLHLSASEVLDKAKTCVANEAFPRLCQLQKCFIKILIFFSSYQYPWTKYFWICIPRCPHLLYQHFMSFFKFYIFSINFNLLVVSCFSFLLVRIFHSKFIFSFNFIYFKDYIFSVMSSLIWTILHILQFGFRFKLLLHKILMLNSSNHPLTLNNNANCLTILLNVQLENLKISFIIVISSFSQFWTFSDISYSWCQLNQLPTALSLRENLNIFGHFSN
jgi:hypothetical protein